MPIPSSPSGGIPKGIPTVPKKIPGSVNSSYLGNVSAEVNKVAPIDNSNIDSNDDLLPELSLDLDDDLSELSLNLDNEKNTGKEQLVTETDTVEPESQSVQRSVPVVNEFDPENDDTFSTLSIDEQLESEENFELPEKTQKTEEKSNKIVANFLKSQKSNSASSRRRKRKNEIVEPEITETGEQNVFIDKESMTLKPFGGKKVKVSDLDKRKNLRTARLIVQTSVIALIMILVGLGAYQAIFPPKPLSEERVAEVAAVALGQTNFPQEKGAAHAKEFIKAYLTVNNETAENVLGYFYSGNLTPYSVTTRGYSSDFAQEILYGPTVYDYKSYTDDTASYTIGAFVSSTQKLADGTLSKEKSEYWIFFNVNTYYDETVGKVYITPDSPSLVPSSVVGSSVDVPKEAKIGTGETDGTLKSSLESTIIGFMKSYAESTSVDYSSLKQYSVSDPDVSLRTGLGNVYEFNASTPDAAMKYDVYLTDDPNVVKVDLTVEWKKSVSGDKNATANFSSRYILTLEKAGDKWLASKFAPYVYIPDYEELEK